MDTRYEDSKSPKVFAHDDYDDDNSSAMRFKFVGGDFTPTAQCYNNNCSISVMRYCNKWRKRSAPVKIIILYIYKKNNNNDNNNTAIQLGLPVMRHNFLGLNDEQLHGDRTI